LNTAVTTPANAHELAAYLDAIQAHPFASLLVALTVVLCIWASRSGGGKRD